jgi:hypothetical protein
MARKGAVNRGLFQRAGDSACHPGPRVTRDVAMFSILCSQQAGLPCVQETIRPLAAVGAAKGREVVRVDLCSVTLFLRPSRCGRFRDERRQPTADGRRGSREIGVRRQASGVRRKVGGDGDRSLSPGTPRTPGQTRQCSAGVPVGTRIYPEPCPLPFFARLACLARDTAFRPVLAPPGPVFRHEIKLPSPSMAVSTSGGKLFRTNVPPERCQRGASVRPHVVRVAKAPSPQILPLGAREAATVGVTSEDAPPLDPPHHHVVEGPRHIQPSPARYGEGQPTEI